MSEELRPCPFCGEMPEVEPNGDCYCDNYICPMAPDSYMPGDWNTRPIEDDLRKRIAELEALVNVSEGLYERIYEQAARIAELEAEVTKGHELQDAYCDRIAELEGKNEKINYFFRKLRMFCIFAHWDNPNTEAEFYKVDAEIREYLSEYKVCIDQLTAHDATERQDDKSSNDTQTQTIVYGKEREE